MLSPPVRLHEYRKSAFSLSAPCALNIGLPSSRLLVIRSFRRLLSYPRTAQSRSIVFPPSARSTIFLPSTSHKQRRHLLSATFSAAFLRRPYFPLVASAYSSTIVRMIRRPPSFLRLPTGFENLLTFGHGNSFSRNSILRHGQVVMTAIPCTRHPFLEEIPQVPSSFVYLLLLSRRLKIQLSRLVFEQIESRVSLLGRAHVSFPVI